SRARQERRRPRDAGVGWPHNRPAGRTRAGSRANEVACADPWGGATWASARVYDSHMTGSAGLAAAAGSREIVDFQPLGPARAGAGMPELRQRWGGCPMAGHEAATRVTASRERVRAYRIRDRR